jgi:hypothetical protein
MDIKQLLAQYAEIFSDGTEENAAHVSGMFTSMRDMLDAIAGAEPRTDEREDLVGKFNRWLAFVHGVMWSHGQRTVDQLRDETRGIDAALRAL